MKIGLLGIITIILVIAKVCGAVTFSWWWVFAPLWLPFLIVLGIIALAAIGVGIVAVVKALTDD